MFQSNSGKLMAANSTAPWLSELCLVNDEQMSN